MKPLIVLDDKKVLGAEVDISYRIKYHHRLAARAVLLDANNRIAIMYASQPGFVKLPGGGVEKEQVIDALHRELLEETGCKIEVIHELGVVTEFRDFTQLKQTSFCYIAKVQGSKGSPQFTTGERALGFKVIWIPTFHKAMQMLTANAAIKNDRGLRFITQRDLVILKAAHKLLT